MSFNDLKNLTTGFIKGWKKGKLKEKLKETAEIAIEEKIKNAHLEEKIRQLKEENLRLKGEKGKPKIKPAPTDKDLNPKPKKPHKKKPKKDKIEIDQVIEIDVDKSDLPDDAKFIGSRDVVVQEIELKRNNIKFEIKRYYSASLNKTFEGELPEGFKGSSFGPKLRSLSSYLFYKNRVPHLKIIDTLLDCFGVSVSKGSMNSILNNIADIFQDDLESARKAAIKKQSRVFIDDTGAKINGVNAFTTGVCNDYFIQYHTGLDKNRWAAAGALLGGELRFRIDSDAISFIAKKLRRAPVTSSFYMYKGLEFGRFEFEEKLKEILKDVEVRKYDLDIIRTACSISALRNNSNGPPIRFLISDDGTNFIDLIKNHQLCWVHEIRKYNKLPIYHEVQVKELNKVIEQWQALYKKMVFYKNDPNHKLKEEISKEFERISSIKTGLTDIDNQLKRTRANKEKLLLFLRYPQVPLHSNDVERDLRERVIKRKISLQNRSWDGVRAWDLMLSLMGTCQKIGINFWRYLEDRISKREDIHYLGRLINQM